MQLRCTGTQVGKPWYLGQYMQSGAAPDSRLFGSLGLGLKPSSLGSLGGLAWDPKVLCEDLFKP